MKVYLLYVVFFVAAIFAQTDSGAQTLPNFDYIKMEQVSDYKVAEPFALQTANYLLSTPYSKDNPDRFKSLQFISRWMSGTPDYAFRVEEMSAKYFKSSMDLLGLYMAGAVKYALENKAGAKDANQLKLHAMTSVLDYCQKPSNNVKLNKSLKKLSEARAEGKLEAAL